MIVMLSEQNPPIADLLMDLEADEELRARLEMELSPYFSFELCG
jgi:hypothetical protein